jgi:nondiscriminating glutamyl-tRNA synthetase
MTETNKQVRVRFAPSPTGFVHIGNVRTGLFSFLLARHYGGVNILRIEDTDQNRKVEGAIEHVIKVMKTLGVEYDEGVLLDENGSLIEKGEHGPYRQSERLDIYKKYADILIEKQAAYYCFCDEQRLDSLRKEQVALKKPPMYDRQCRYLSKEVVDDKLSEFEKLGHRPVIRQAIPEEGSTTYHDIIYGDITIEHKILDDQVLLKSDMFPTYHLAVVVDDHLMEITHVIRGEEYLPSAPKHFLMYQAFGWQPPLFAHAPLILNLDRSKLSKRQGDVATEDFLNKGYLPQALVNFVVMLGWNPKTEQEIFSMQDLIDQFDLAKVNKSGAILDMNKLDWLNGLYIRQMDIVELTDKLIPYWIEAGQLVRQGDELRTLAGLSITETYLQAIAKLERDRLKKLSDIGERTQYYFAQPEYQGALLVWKKSDAATTKKILQELQEFFGGLNENEFVLPNLENQLKQFIIDRGYDNGSVLWPLRAALTGLEKSPGPFEVAATLALGLGKNEVIARLAQAQAKL